MHSEVNIDRIRVTGLVQGVGFRPYVWRIARSLQVCGHVFNDGSGVVIEVLSSPATDHLASAVKDAPPPLSRIDSIITEHNVSASGTAVPAEGFHITESQSSEVRTGCPPDAAMCDACRDELFDENDRRYRYPFLNCTHCGPRLSIIKNLPYDRASTTMSDFTLCETCNAEYHEPADRRFHAQPVACAACGPAMWLEDTQGNQIDAGDPFEWIAARLKSGDILALKGLGGFHLVCDATNLETVTRLRERKRRPHKAFALMMQSIEQAERYVTLSETEKALLMSPRSPVVLASPLLQSAVTDKALAGNIAPDTNRLGVMLPYTPLHALVMEAAGIPLVMTSGNASGQPQATDNIDARRQLATIADGFVMHNRPVHSRVDDSVAQVANGHIHYFRLARGYAPLVMPLPEGFTADLQCLATGAELKNTFCMTQAGKAIISQHMGDLSDVQTCDAFEHSIALYQSLYQFTADVVSCDLHPDYASTRLAGTVISSASDLAADGAALYKVQHHHAHLAACLGDNEIPLASPAVLGICLDGTGLGSDGTLWGGEALFGGYRSVVHAGGLSAAPLPGGTQAILSPWRTLYGRLYGVLNAQQTSALAEFVPALSSPVAATLGRMIDKQLNCPLSSSAGRLFDAVAALLGCYATGITYEGQAAVALQGLAEQGQPLAQCYRFALTNGRLDPLPVLLEMIEQRRTGVSTASMAHNFHLSLAQAFTELTISLNQKYSFDTVALTGGVMQNTLLLSMLKQGLSQAGFRVLTHRSLPANDANIAYGQALVTLANHSDPR